MCPLGTRVRYADASLGGHLAGTVSGAVKVEEQRMTRIGNGDSRGAPLRR